MNEMKERLFKHYNLNKTSLGKLVKGISKSMAPVNLTDMHLGADDNLGPGNSPMMNWTALLGANKFLMALQRDMMRKEAGLDNEIGATEMTSVANIFGTMRTSDEPKENSVSNSNGTKTSSLWGRARTLAARAPENGNINEGYSEETV